MHAGERTQDQIGAAVVVLLDARHELLPRQVQVIRTRLRDWVRQQREQQPGFEAIEDLDQLQLRLPDVAVAIECARSLLALNPAEGAQQALLRMGLALPSAVGEGTAALLSQAHGLALASAAGEWSVDAQQQRSCDALLSLAWAESPRPERLVYVPPLPRARNLEPRGLLPVLAVVPLQRRAGRAEFDVVGELFADALINLLSQFSQLRVLARRSTSELRAQAMDLPALQAGLGASHVLSGRFSVGLGNSLLIEVSLHDCERGVELWHERYQGLVDDLVHGDLDLVGQCATEVARCLLQSSLQAVSEPGWTELRDFQRLISAGTLLFRLGDAAFARARELLDQLQQRHPRSALVHAWLAIWHTMQVLDGRCAIEAGKRAARQAAETALGLDPDQPLAHASLAHQLTALERRPDLSLAHSEQALRGNPNEPMAWLFRGLAMAVLDRGDEASQAALLGQCLSPLDPWSHTFDLVTASALASAGRWSEALDSCQRSLRICPGHGAAMRQLITILQAMDRGAEARLWVERLLKQRPNYTVARYRSVTNAAHFPAMEREARLLAAAGVPLS